jgi:hypothetical protein
LKDRFDIVTHLYLFDSVIEAAAALMLFTKQHDDAAKYSYRIRNTKGTKWSVVVFHQAMRIGMIKFFPAEEAG